MVIIGYIILLEMTDGEECKFSDDWDGGGGVARAGGKFFGRFIRILYSLGNRLQVQHRDEGER